MKRLILGLVLIFALSGCADKQTIPEVAFKGTTVEELVDKPNPSLMVKAPPKQKLEKGLPNGKASSIVANNNLRAGAIENRLESLQQYVCNLFKESVGEVCKKGK